MGERSGDKIALGKGAEPLQPAAPIEAPKLLLKRTDGAIDGARIGGRTGYGQARPTGRPRRDQTRAH
jgi:hypothetical protein